MKHTAGEHLPVRVTEKYRYVVALQSLAWDHLRTQKRNPYCRVYLQCTYPGESTVCGLLKSPGRGIPRTSHF